MGNAVAADGSMAIQCQSCHGAMSAVGAPTRTGWLEEPTCQNCHTGTATNNNGADPLHLRLRRARRSCAQPVDPPSPPRPTRRPPGLSLYRFSTGHGGLQCEACHGSTHAEFPSSHPNDNVQSIALQGHVGTLGECTACHGDRARPRPTAARTACTRSARRGCRSHGDAAEGEPHAVPGLPRRRLPRHGAVARVRPSGRSRPSFGTKTLFRGAQVGCYICHNGPSSESANPNRPPVASNLSRVHDRRDSRSPSRWRPPTPTATR